MRVFLCILFLECPLSGQLVLYVFIIMCPQKDCCPLSVGLQTVLWHGWLVMLDTAWVFTESQCVQKFRKLALNNEAAQYRALSSVLPGLCAGKLQVVD